MHNCLTYLYDLLKKIIFEVIFSFLNLVYVLIFLLNSYHININIKSKFYYKKII